MIIRMAVVNADSLRNTLGGQLQLSQSDLAERMRETLLVRNGVYCARRFAIDGYTLTWFVEENQVKLTGPNGKLLSATSALAFVHQQSSGRRAA
jgi:hypothetical protein